MPFHPLNNNFYYLKIQINYKLLQKVTYIVPVSGITEILCLFYLCLVNGSFASLCFPMQKSGIMIHDICAYIH